MKAKRVIETCLYVDDLEAAEQFYSTILGLEVFHHADGRNLFFRCENGMFLLFNPEVTREVTVPGMTPHGAFGAGHAAFSMNLDEVDAWRDHLKRHGVEIESDFNWPSGGKSLYFRDPAGNSLELTTPKTWGLDE